MKVIMVHENGYEQMVCESIDTYHGLLMVNLFNGNYATKVKNIEYKLVNLDYELNNKNI